MGDKHWSKLNMYQYKQFDPRSNMIYRTTEVRPVGNYQLNPMHQHPPPSYTRFAPPITNFCPIPMFDRNFPPNIECHVSKRVQNPIDNISTKEIDWFCGWVKTAEKMKPIKDKDMKLETVQENVIKTVKLIKSLEELKSSMENKEEIICQNTDYKMNEVKHQISNLLQYQHSPNYKTKAKQCLLNRRNRRKIRKDNAHNRKEKKQLRLKNLSNKSKAIDNWRDLIIKREQDELQEEQLKNEADKILCEVRKKQEQSQKMMLLLNNLDELRNNRIKRLSASGVPVDEDGSKLFHSLKDNIKETIENQLCDYQLEEKTLRVMMEKTPNRALLKRSNIPALSTIQSEIHEILFGSKENMHLEKSLDHLIEIRKEWDKFISDSNLASSIPINWVVPPQIGSCEWQNYQCTNL